MLQADVIRWVSARTGCIAICAAHGEGKVSGDGVHQGVALLDRQDLVGLL
jgi:hypothetical protein